MQIESIKTETDALPLIGLPPYTPKAAKPGVSSRIRLVALLLLASQIFQACLPNRKLVYLQDDRQKTGTLSIYKNEFKPYRLQVADVLSVTIKGVEAELSATFNSTPPGAAMSFADPGTQFILGYSIDEAGDISLPTVGRVRVVGLTLTEVNELIQQKIGLYLRDANVSVKLSSFKITILGEVKRPGYFFVNNNHCTILEGLGIGGDVATTANRKRIKLIRQVGGNTEIVILDLTDANLARSPYFYLQPNDVIFVEPLTGQIVSRNYTPVNLILGIIGGIATITLLIISVNNYTRR